MIENADERPIHNSWGDASKIISMADAQKGIKERYTVYIKSLTYKGYEIGDVPIMWWDQSEKNGKGDVMTIYRKSERAAAH